MAIANDLHMLTPGLRGLTGEELDRMDEDTFRPLAAVVDVYSRVSPPIRCAAWTPSRPRDTSWP